VITLEELVEIIDGHCCFGCDGYQCPNSGIGKKTEEIAADIFKILQEKP